jgi:hypothetical protein
MVWSLENSKGKNKNDGLNIARKLPVYFVFAAFLFSIAA